MRALLTAFLAAVAAVPPAAQEAPALAHREVRVLDLSGTPHERGLAHGRALKEQIHRILGDFYRDIERAHQVDRATFVDRFLRETDFEPAIERWTPGLLDEVRGIAEGAELPFRDVFVLQLIDEVWSMGRWALRDKCTAIAVDRRGDQPTIVAQNMDIPGFLQRFPTVLRVRRDDGPDAMLLTCPGVIGVNGINAAAVAVCCNTLLQLRPSAKGLPVLFVVRGLLRHESLAEAEAWLRRIPHASGQNYTVGDRGGARAFECSAGRVARYSPAADADFTYHTNHPLVNRDWHPSYLERCERRGIEPEAGLPDCRRFASLQERIRAGSAITPDTIVAALASRDDDGGPICGDWNYACTLFVLGDEPELRLAPGRPDRFALQRLRRF